jgi:glycosyltransferase involved in cell wall biosynthesis
MPRIPGRHCTACGPGYLQHCTNMKPLATQQRGIPVKICIVTTQFGNFWSGLGTYATNLINGLAADGHQVSVICRSPDTGKAHPGVHFVDSTPHMSNWVMLAWQCNQLVQRLLQHEAFDVVHFADAREGLFCRSDKTLVSGMMNDYYFVEASKNPLYYRKYYTDWLKRWLFYNVSRLLEQQAIRSLPLVLTNTDYVTRSLIANYGTAAHRTHTVYYGLDAPPATSAPPAERLTGTPSVLFAGSNFQRKGLPVLIKAMAIVVASHAQALLHVVGKDAKQAAMETLVAQYALGNNVRFYGGMENSQLQLLYPRADLFAMPSLVEGFGLVFLEAMAAGTPVIGGLCGGTPELIKDGENGFVVPPANPELLARRIIALTTDANLRRKFADAGRQTCSDYPIARMVSHTVALFRQFKTTS